MHFRLLRSGVNKASSSEKYVTASIASLLKPFFSNLFLCSFVSSSPFFFFFFSSDKVIFPWILKHLNVFTHSTYRHYNFYLFVICYLYISSNAIISLVFLTKLRGGKIFSLYRYDKSGNEQFVTELSKWVFHERGHLKVNP